MKRHLVSLILVAATVLAAGCTPATPIAGTPATVRIGIAGPFTGPTAKLGELVKFGSEMAAEEVNAAGGVNVGGNKIPIELYFGDTTDQIEATVAVTERLITQDQVYGIVGYVHSSPALAAMEVAQGHKIPVIDTVATTSQIAQRIGEGNAKGETQYGFQLSPTSYDRGLSEAAAAIDLVHPRILCSILANNDLGRDIDKYTREYFAKHAPDATWAVVEFPDVNATEYYSEINKVVNAKCDIVFVSMSGVSTSAFTKQFVELRPKAVPIFDGSEFAQPEFLVQFGDIAEGWLVNLVWSNEAPVTSKTIDFVKKWQAKHGFLPSYIEAQQYEGVLTMVAAIEAAGSLNADSIQQALLHIEFEGVTGIIKFTADDHRVLRELVIAQIQDKKHVVVWPEHAKTGEYIAASP